MKYDYMVDEPKEKTNKFLIEKYNKELFEKLTAFLHYYKLDKKYLKRVLSKKERKYLKIYTKTKGKPNYWEINRKTRNGEKLTSDEQKLFDIVNKALNSFVMPVNITLYRGFSIDSLNQCDMFDENGNPKIGSILSFKSLTSTSFSVTTIYDYLETKNNNFNVICKIDCKKGSKGLCLFELSAKKNDYEFLMPYGTTYRINNAVKKENNFTFEIEII